MDAVCILYLQVEWTDLTGLCGFDFVTHKVSDVRYAALPTLLGILCLNGTACTVVLYSFLFKWDVCNGMPQNLIVLHLSKAQNVLNPKPSGLNRNTYCTMGVGGISYHTLARNIFMH
jgi:hypothetical protein